MNKRLTLLICNDMRDGNDPIVVAVSGATPEAITQQAMIAHAECEMSDFDGDRDTAADLWHVSRAWIMAAIPGAVTLYYSGGPDPESANHERAAILEALNSAPHCIMGANHE